MSLAPNDITEEGLINFSSQRHMQRSSYRDRPSLFQQSSGRDQEDILRGYDSPFMHRGESSPFPSVGISAGRQSVLDQKERQDKQESNDEKEGLEFDKSLKQEVKRMSLMQIIFNMKLKMLAQRLVLQLKSRMFLNLTPFQHRLIDDKSYVQSNTLSALKTRYNRDNSQVKSRNSFGNGDDNKRALTLKKLKYQQGYMPDYQEQETEESNFLLIRIIQRTFFSLETQKFLHQLSLKIPLFHPSSIFKIFWDFASMCLIVFFLIMIPIYVTFFDQINIRLNHLVIVLAPCYVFMDTLININSSYYEKGLLIKRRSFIIANYWKKYSATEFFIITVCIIHLLQVYQKDTHSWTRFLLLVFILKIQHCASIFRKFEELFISKRSHQIMDLAKLISVIMIIGHFISCLWLLIAQFEEQIGEEKTWISARIFSGNEWSYKYIEAFYFSMVTMVTVGYGDVLPITPIEKTTCVILMLVSCGIFAYSMNTIGNILENFNQEELIISKKMHIINTYMSNKNVNKRMQYAIREYLDYYWREASERDQEAEEKIIRQLSDQLKENLLIEANKIVLKQSSVFRKNFSAQIKQRMIPLIREYRCTPEEIICSEGDVDDSSIFFIEKGSVQFFIDTSNGNSQTKQTPLITLHQGDSFGELSFFTGLPRCSSVRSKEFTTLLMIKREHFIDLLKQFPEDFEQFMAIKDSLCLYEDYQILDMHCYSCGSSQHLVYHCPFIHMKSNIEKIIFLFNKSPNQERKTYQRVRQRKQNSIAGGIEYYLECAREFISLNNDHPNVLIYVENNPNSYQKSHQSSKVKLSVPLLSNEVFDKDSISSSQSDEEEDNKTSVSMRNQQLISLKKRSKFVNSISDTELSMEMPKQHNQQTPPVSMSNSEEYSPQQNQLSKDPLNQQGQRRKSRRVTNLLQMAEVKEEEEGEERSHQNNNNMIPRRRSMYYDDGHQQQQQQSSSISNPLYGKYFQEEQNLATSQGTTPSNNLRHVAHSQNTAPRLDNSAIQKSNPFIVLPSQQVRGRTNSLQNQVAELIQILRGILPTNYSRNTRIPRLPQITNPTANSINSNLSIQMVPLRRGSKFFSSISQTVTNSEYFKQQTDTTIDQQNNLTQILGAGEFCENMPNFDVMKNFDIYFPFNNLVYQLKLMGINREEKRRKMLRNHFMNQQTLKCHIDSPMTTISRFGNNNNNMNNSKSSIQKVVIKYQREMEEQENQTVSDLRKSKFHTSTKIGQGMPIDSFNEGSSTFKTLNLINLHRNSASLSAGLKNSNKLSSKFKAQTSLHDDLKNTNSKQQQQIISLESSSEQVNIPQSVMYPSSNDQIYKDPLLSIDLHSDIFKVLTDTGQKNSNLIDKEEDNKNGIHFIKSILFNQDQRNSKSVGSAKQFSFDHNESNYFQGILLHNHSENLQQNEYNDYTLKELSPISNEKNKKQDDSPNQEFESFNVFEQSDTSIQNINEINLSLAHKPKKRPLIIHPIIENQSSSSVDN